VRDFATLIADRNGSIVRRVRSESGFWRLFRGDAECATSPEDFTHCGGLYLGAILRRDDGTLGWCLREDGVIVWRDATPEESAAIEAIPAVLPVEVRPC